jgi:hypothetical protein
LEQTQGESGGFGLTAFLPALLATFLMALLPASWRSSPKISS